MAQTSICEGSDLTEFDAFNLFAPSHTKETCKHVDCAVLWEAQRIIFEAKRKLKNR